MTALLLSIGVPSAPVEAVITCDQQGMQTRPIQLGVSGGNIDAFLTINHQKFCDDGTLGSLVEDQNNNQFILSNNHVLANINKAKKGQLIVQPGLADTACQKITSDAVATFSRTVKIKFGSAKNTVDAAIALVEAGDVSADILNIGGIAGSIVTTPTIGMPVQKMGRTTCLTAATISGVNFSGTVGYPVGGKIKGAKFVNQIVINSAGPPDNFGGPGDSGSLIVTQAACPEAVGLLFAGSSDQTQTIANPISSVLDALKVAMVGSCTPMARTDTTPADLLAGDAGTSKDAVVSATAVRDRHEDELMNIPGAVGTAVGASDQPGQPAIIVYLKKMTPEAQAAAPKDVEGVPVKLIANGGFVAY